MNKKVETYINIFKALSDETRLRIVWVLLQSKSQLCVCEIMDALKITQYNTSRHIKVLKECGLVRVKKYGRFVMCSIPQVKQESIKMIFEAISKMPEQLFARDRERLIRRVALRQNDRIIGREKETVGSKQ